MKNIKISIIIPTYNSAETLKASLDSIVNQSYTSKEVWIIDGISNDNTIDIVKEYATKFSFINYVSEPDKGIYDAMNKGISLAQGEWLYFLGSDDTFFDEKVLDLIFNSTNPNINNFDIIYGNVVFKENNKISSDHINFKINDFQSTNLNHQSVFYRKQVFEIIGKYNIEYKVFADWEFNIRTFFSMKFKISYINCIVAYYSILGCSNKTTDDFPKHLKTLVQQQYNQLSKENKISFHINQLNTNVSLHLIKIFFLRLYKLLVCKRNFTK